jgi:general secretion pathway protein G
VRLLRTLTKPVLWCKIIVAPALTPLLQLIAGLGLVISLCLIVLGVFAEPPRDHNQVRYMLGTLQVEALAKAVERYKEDCGEYPDVRDGFNGLILDPGVEGWRGPYLKEVPLDPWHRPYVYLRSADSTPEILSYGADRKPGGEFFDADISSRNVRHSMPHSPFEIRARRLLIGIWIGAWFCLIGSLLVLRRTSRRHRG